MLSATGVKMSLKSFHYELTHHKTKLSLDKLVTISVTSILSILLNSTTLVSFFTDKCKSPIPEQVQFLKKQPFAQFFSTFILLIPASLSANEVRKAYKSKENKSVKRIKNLDNIIKLQLNNNVQSLKNEILDLRTTYSEFTNLSNNINIALFVPIRMGFNQWEFRPVSYTDNYIQNARLDFHESFVGYSLSNLSKRTIKLHYSTIEIISFAQLPSNYIQLDSHNWHCFGGQSKLKGHVCMCLCDMYHKIVNGIIVVNINEMTDLELFKNQETIIVNTLANWLNQRNITDLLDFYWIYNYDLNQ